MENFEKKPFKTILHLSGAEFNLQSVLSLLSKNNIKISEFGASGGGPGGEDRVTENNLPVEDALLTLEAPEEEVRKVLLNSEFKEHVDKLLGHGLN